MQIAGTSAVVSVVIPCLDEQEPIGGVVREVLAVVVVSQTVEEQPISNIRAAVTRALPLLQHSACEFVANKRARGEAGVFDMPDVLGLR